MCCHPRPIFAGKPDTWDRRFALLQAQSPTMPYRRSITNVTVCALAHLIASRPSENLIDAPTGKSVKSGELRATFPPEQVDRFKPAHSDPCPVLCAGTASPDGDTSASLDFGMLMVRERPPGYRTIEAWARAVLSKAGAIRKCEEHGWMQDHADPHARDRAVEMARETPGPGSLRAAAVTIAEVLDGIGNTCPECPPKGRTDGLDEARPLCLSEPT